MFGIGHYEVGSACGTELSEHACGLERNPHSRRPLIDDDAGVQRVEPERQRPPTDETIDVSVCTFDVIVLVEQAIPSQEVVARPSRDDIANLVETCRTNASQHRLEHVL
jgi:hypothetical protein